MRAFLTISAVFLVALLPMRGEAQSVTTEIKRYNDIIVSFNQDAEQCNVTDAARFKRQLRKDLESADVRQSDASLLVVNFSVSASAFGAFGMSCVYTTTLSFLFTLKAENIVTDNPAARAAIDRLGEFDVVVYTDGIFGVESQLRAAVGAESTAVRDRVLDDIGILVARLANRRKQ